MTRARLLAASLLLAFSVPAAAAPAPDEFEDYREIYQDLVKRHADAIVTVKFVMSVTNSGNEQRVEDRTQAALVGRDGLLLVPDRAVSVDFAAFGNTTPGQTAPVAKSSEFRVRLAGTEDWLPADLVTRDAELGIAWLRLRGDHDALLVAGVRHRHHELHGDDRIGVPLHQVLVDLAVILEFVGRRRGRDRQGQGEQQRSGEQADAVHGFSVSQ